MSEFTIGIVNYKTSDFIELQLKIYHQFAEDDYNMLILDTSEDDKEYQKLNELSEQYSRAIQVMRYVTKSKDGSGAHGEGLQFIYNKVKSKYVLMQDPDFFWVKPAFLKYLKQLLIKHDVVGAPPNESNIISLRELGILLPNFPSAFGAVYKMQVLREIGANFESARSTVPKKYQVSKDVGYQIRDKIGNRSYFSFKQKKCTLKVDPIFLKDLSRTYLDQNDMIAHHLYRSSVIMSPAYSFLKHKDHSKWVNNRKMFCMLLWDEINKKSS